MLRRVLPLIAIASLAVAACAGDAATPSPEPTEAASPTPAGPVVIEVSLTDALRIEPDPITIPIGEVTFRVTNTGVLDHEFVVGSEAEQQAHQEDMSGGGMMMDDDHSIGVDPGQTKDLTMTFDRARSLLAGCHVDGHYAAGMKAAMEVTE